MNELKIFNNPDFGQVRMMMIEDTPYFVGKDVADILGYVMVVEILILMLTKKIS